MLKISGRAPIIAVAALVVAPTLVAGSQGAAAARAAVPAAYQSAVSTTVTISNAPRARAGNCVSINIAVTSDAGTPTGSVAFAVDGTAASSGALPSNGIVNEVIGCSSAARFRTLATGPHTLAAQFTPTGNWAPSHGTGAVVITAGAVVSPSTVPHGVDAGLSQFGALPPSGGSDPRPWISGTALVLAVGFIARYRRRRTQS